MDVVCNREDFAHARAFPNSGIEVSPATMFHQVDMSNKLKGPLTDEIRQQAREAVAQREDTAHTRIAHLHLVKDSDLGSLSPGVTPSFKSRVISERVAELHKTGHSANMVQQTMSKDNFGREYELG